MRRLLLASALLAGAAGIGCPHGDAVRLEQARSLSSGTRADLSSAQRILTEIIDDTEKTEDPARLALRRDALMLRGQTYRGLGMYAAAEADFRVVVDVVDPGNPYAYVQLATALAERGDASQGDLDRSIDAAVAALASLADYPPAMLAAGNSHLQRARFRRSELAAELRSTALGGSLAGIAAGLDEVLGLPESHPRSIALQRVIDRALEFRSVDTRARVAASIAAARSDFLRAGEFLLKGLSLHHEDRLAMWRFLELLTETGRVDEALALARTAMDVPVYREHPYVVDAAARAIASAGAPREAIELLGDYVESGRFNVPMPMKLRLLRTAASMRDAQVLGSTIDRVRKKLGRDHDSQMLSRALEYFDGLLLHLQGKPDAEVAAKLGGFVARQDPETGEFLPEAARILARAQQRLGNVNEALFACDIGVGNAPRDADLLALRASVRLALGGDPSKLSPELRSAIDPLRIAEDLRLALIVDPRGSERYLYLLRVAAERYVGRFGQTLQGIEDDGLLRTSGVPTGYTESWLHLTFARDYFGRNQFAASAASALSALSRDADLLPALVLAGLSRARLGERNDARQAFLRASEAIPSDPEILRAIAESGAAPPDIDLRQILARPEVEGRVVLARSLLEEERLAEAEEILVDLARSADATSDARLLAARLLAADGRADFEPLLEGLPPGTRAASAAIQVRLEAALARDDAAGAAEQADRLRAEPAGIDVPRLFRVVERARREGRAAASVPAARLLADLGSQSGRLEKFHVLGHTLLEAGQFDEAVHVFDRLVALHNHPDNAMWLGYALVRKGDTTGAHEALLIARRDWGANPLDMRRACLAQLAGTTPQAEELLGVQDSLKIDDPLSVVAAAAISIVGSGKPPDATRLPRVSPWVDAAVLFAGAGSERARLALQLVIALRTPGGAQEALTEIRALQGTEGADPIGLFLEGEALSQVASRSAEALRAYTSAARALPDLDAAWSRAWQVARDRGDLATSHGLAEEWAAARPEQPESFLARWLGEVEQHLATGDDLKEQQRLLAEVVRARPDHFESVFLLLRIRQAIGDVVPSIQAARETVRLAAASPTRMKRCASAVVAAYRAGLPAAAAESREVATRIQRTLPDSTPAVLLSASADLAEQRPIAAAELVLEFLREPLRTATLDTEDWRRLGDLLWEREPTAAVEVARLAVSQRPSDEERWNLYARRLLQLGRSEEAIVTLTAWHAIAPRQAAAVLGEALANSGRQPERALALLGADVGSEAAEAPTARTQRSAARALRLLDRGQDAVSALAPLLESTAAEPLRPADEVAIREEIAWSEATVGEPDALMRARASLLRAAEIAATPRDASRLQAAGALWGQMNRLLRAASMAAAAPPANAGPQRR